MSINQSDIKSQTYGTRQRLSFGTKAIMVFTSTTSLIVVYATIIIQTTI